MNEKSEAPIIQHVVWTPDRAMHFTIAQSYHRLIGQWCDGAMVG